MRYQALWRLRKYMRPLLGVLIAGMAVMVVTGLLEARTMAETQHVFRPIFMGLQLMGGDRPEETRKIGRSVGADVADEEGGRIGEQIGREVARAVGKQLSGVEGAKRAEEIGKQIGEREGRRLGKEFGQRIGAQVAERVNKKQVVQEQERQEVSVWKRLGGLLGVDVGGDEGIGERPTGDEIMENVYYATGRLLGFFLAAALATALSFYLGQYLSQSLLVTLRREVFVHLQSLSLGFFDSRETGELISRINNDTQLLQDLLGRSLARLVIAPVTVIACVAVMLLISPMLTGMVFVMVPVILGLNSVIGGKVRKFTRQVRERFADLTSAISETFHGIRVVKIFGMEPLTYKRFDDENVGVFRYEMRVARMRASNRIFVGGLTGIAICGALLLGAREVALAHTDAAGLMTFILLMQTAASRISHIARINLHFQRAEAAATRLLDILDEEPELAEPEEPAKVDGIRGEVALQQVTFAYDEEPVLQDISLEIEPGEAVALVGASGAGKSTVANLVARLYDVDDGAVQIDGVDVRKLSADVRKQHLGIVPQEIILFSASVRENIEYGRPGATEEEIIEAARAANAHDFIVELPKGYDTQVGEQGAKLSGGQRQRVAIARALLRNPPILILDEATSSLDAESEAAIHEALQTLVADRTTIIIAHRLSTVTNADRIVVLDRGRIVEQGTHQELMAQDGVYRRLYETGTFSSAAKAGGDGEHGSPAGESIDAGRAGTDRNESECEEEL